jgi:hypothetical protein
VKVRNEIVSGPGGRQTLADWQPIELFQPAGA